MFWLLTALAAPPAVPALPDLAGLAGCWQTEPGAAYTGQETWLGPVDGVMVGALLGQAGGEVTWEQLRIGPVDGTPTLLVTPKGQELTAFALHDHSAQHWEFRNPTHDFPQCIRYERQGEGLVVRAEARDDAGQWKGIELRYRRCTP